MSHLPDESRTGREPLEVALLAMVRRGPDGWEVLLTRRAPEVHLGGYWELPGGKVESSAGGPQGQRGESPRLAASREALEELGLTIDPQQLVACGRTSYAYPDRIIRFYLFMLQLGVESGIDVRQIKRGHAWARIDQLDDWDLPPANAAINRLLCEQLREL